MGGGKVKPRKLNCFFIFLSPLGLKIDYYDILTFLHRYWSSYWPLVGALIRKLKGLHVSTERQEANCFM